MFLTYSNGNSPNTEIPVQLHSNVLIVCNYKTNRNSLGVRQVVLIELRPHVLSLFFTHSHIIMNNMPTLCDLKWDAPHSH